MDDTYGVLRPMLELTAVIPAAILCCLPTRDHLRIPPRLLLLAGVPLLLLWAAVGGWLCWNLSCSTNWWLFPWLIVFALQGCVESGDLNAVADYVSAHLPTLPLDSGRVYCRNFALNAVLCNYMDLAVQQNTDMTISVQMEEETVIPEPELCALVGNLLENALEACIWLRNNRPIQVRISQEGRSTLAITVDNPCPQPPQREGNLLLSTKHKGPGFGTQSVRIIAEHYHGDARFEWEDGVFRASVLLNP